MLEIRFIRENRDLVGKALKARGNDLALESLLKVDSQRRKLLQEVEDLRNIRNRVSEKIGRQKKERKDTGELIAQMKKVASRIKELNNLLEEKEISLFNAQHTSPLCSGW
jgi:seryl-tRNA synthetase